MGERGFAEPVRATERVETNQTLKPQRWAGQELRLMWIGAILGSSVTALFAMGVVALVIGGR